jgi:hypothetical protein
LSRHLHIISSTFPHPPDNGRLIDTLGKIIALYHNGIKIHLHYLKQPDRKDSHEVSNYCESIDGYESRHQMNEILRQKFSRDDFPLLIEGNFCSNILDPLDTKLRKVLIRFYNDEPGVGSFPLKGRPFEKLFSFYSKKISNDQADFHNEYVYVCISENDAETLKKQYRLQHVTFLPPFVTWNHVKSKEGNGNFCLYHGDLSEPANEKTAIWLLEQVFSEIRCPFVIAGKNPSRRLYKLTQLYSHCCIVANPSEGQINDLIQKAHINIVPSISFVCGRYKLLHSLFFGRHCVTNYTMVGNTGLEKACHIANDRRAKIECVKRLMDIPFTSEEIGLRKQLLSEYNNSENICRLINWLY